MDKHHGQGGTYKIEDGVRVLVTAPGAPHPDGDRPRDADGKPIDVVAAKNEPALPAPGAAPWATDVKGE